MSDTEVDKPVRCGWCWRPLSPEGPSLDFCDEIHQRHWMEGDPLPLPVLPIVTDLAPTIVGDGMASLSGAFGHVARATAAAARALARLKGAA